MSVSMEKPSQITGSSDSCRALDRDDFPEPEGPSKMISFDECGMGCFRKEAMVTDGEIFKFI